MTRWNSASGKYERGIWTSTWTGTSRTEADLSGGQRVVFSLSQTWGYAWQGDQSGLNDTNWLGTFAGAFLKLSGGPGNVPTCAAEALTSIVNQFNPFTPGVSTAAGLAAPVVQKAVTNRALLQTAAEVNAYLASAGKAAQWPVLRGIAATESAVTAGARANIAVQTAVVDYAAFKSLTVTSGQARNGQCAAAFPIF